MAAYLWRIKVTKPIGKLAQGMWAEVIVQNSATRKPTNKEISEAFNAKYGDKTITGGISWSFYEMVKG